MGTLEELADRVKLPAEMEAACAAALEKNCSRNWQVRHTECMQGSTVTDSGVGSGDR